MTPPAIEASFEQVSLTAGLQEDAELGMISTGRQVPAWSLRTSEAAVVRRQLEEGRGTVNPRDLMRVHVNTLFISDEGGRLRAVNDSARGVAPRFFLGRTQTGNVWCARHDIGSDLLNDLRSLCNFLPNASALEADLSLARELEALVSSEGEVRKRWAGPAYWFGSELPQFEGAVRVTSRNAELLSPYFEDRHSDLAQGAPMAVAVEHGHAVSLCCSVRVTPSADEAGVETHPDYRNCGHATRVVAVWAKMVREQNRIPLYSTSWENMSSLAVAKRLGLVPYGVDLHVT